MNEVQIKPYKRKGKNGTLVSVSGYTRRVGKKGVRSPRQKRTAQGNQPSQSISAGNELLSKKGQTPKKVYPPLSPAEEKWVKDWDAAARKAGRQNVSFAYAKQQASSKKAVSEVKSLTKDVFKFVKKKK